MAELGQDKIKLDSSKFLNQKLEKVVTECSLIRNCQPLGIINEIRNRNRNSLFQNHI